MKTVIQDSKTKMFYAVECSENPKGYLTSANDEGNPGDNDFPYWTEDMEEAYDFGSEALAQNEMSCNDTTDSGERNPVIVTV
uniref:hypothetical protein n=1 Tax=Roseivirga sp. TaxID=1964215 RepID=UPI004048246E